jgi:hypothetical protein
MMTQHNTIRYDTIQYAKHALSISLSIYLSLFDSAKLYYTIYSSMSLDTLPLYTNTVLYCTVYACLATCDFFPSLIDENNVRMSMHACTSTSTVHAVYGSVYSKREEGGGLCCYIHHLCLFERQQQKRHFARFQGETSGMDNRILE